MLVTQELTMVEAHGKQYIQHLVNLGRKKRTGALVTGANGMNTGMQLTTQKIAGCNTTRKRIRPASPNGQKKIIEDQFGVS